MIKAMQTAQAGCLVEIFELQTPQLAQSQRPGHQTKNRIRLPQLEKSVSIQILNLQNLLIGLAL